MKRAMLIAVIFAAGASGACAPILGAPMMGRGMYTPPPRPTVSAAPTSPFGRWDEVMSLRSNWIVEVLDAEGFTHTGRFVRASLHSLKFVTTGGEHELARPDVIRVDLIQADDGPGTTAKEVGLGAAAGAAGMAGAMALVPFLAAGKLIVPPARFWATGALLGGAKAAQAGREARRPRTIYLARINDM
jgi:hypothetical protein